ncbi:MAG TPA: HTTM domain-containing protein [Kofleriaceae bacterium]
MKRWWTAWVALWDRREPVTAMALVRIFVGVCLVWDVANSYHGGIHGGIIDGVFSTTSGYARHNDGWSNILGADPGPLLVHISMVMSLCILFGVATPVALVGYAFVASQLADIAPYTDHGVFPLLRIACVLLAFGRAGNRWSVDAFVAARIGKPLATVVPAWPRYLLMAQLVWVYASGGQNKSSSVWGPFGGFRAIENIVSDPSVARFAPGWVAPFTIISRMATAATITFEVCAPVYLIAYYFAATPDGTNWRRARRVFALLRLRWIWILLGLSFHIGIAVTLHLGIFPWGMLALYPVLLRPEEIAAGVQRLKGVMPAKRASSPS